MTRHDFSDKDLSYIDSDLEEEKQPRKPDDDKSNQKHVRFTKR